MQTLAPETIALANFITALGILIGVVKLFLKLDDDNTRQNRQISRILRELRINTECNKAALETHITNGADGVCHDALKKLNDFLNDAAHSAD